MKSAERKLIAGFSGESVVLLCSCTDLQTKPNTVKWEFRSVKSGTSHFEEIYPSQTGQHRDRVRLTTKNSGNLSLLISDLTEEDQGDYRCSVQRDHRYIRLHIKGNLCLSVVTVNIINSDFYSSVLFDGNR